MLRHPRTDQCGVFADPRREDERVEPLQGSYEHACVEADPINEIVDSELRTGVFTCLELTHITADTGETLQAAICIEKPLHLGRRHSFLGDQIEQNSRIDRGEAHRALDTASSTERTH